MYLRWTDSCDSFDWMDACGCSFSTSSVFAVELWRRSSTGVDITFCPNIASFFVLFCFLLSSGERVKIFQVQCIPGMFFCCNCIRYRSRGLIDLSPGYYLFWVFWRFFFLKKNRIWGLRYWWRELLIALLSVKKGPSDFFSGAFARPTAACVWCSWAAGKGKGWKAFSGVITEKKRMSPRFS